MTILALKGEVDRDIAALFVEQLASLGRPDAPVTLDMREAELEDAAVTALLVDALRHAALRTGGLQVLEAPQVLAHCLYRVGALGKGSTIQLVEPREELGTSS